jgi:hypothetical protein
MLLLPSPGQQWLARFMREHIPYLIMPLSTCRYLYMLATV